MKNKMTRILALAAAALLAATMTACGAKTDGTDTTAAAADASAVEPVDASTEAALTEAPTDADDTTTEAGVPADETTEPAATEAVITTTAAAVEDTTATTAESTTEEAKAPTDKAEILKLYNDATAKVAQQKVAFSKRRETKEGVYDAGVALKTFKGLVYKFMGIGSENIYTQQVSKGDGDYNHYFLASKLTASDITGASCTLGSDGSYNVTINVKPGSSHIDGGSGETLNAPIDKSGISAGRNDKGYWDHKTAQNVYDAIDDVASGAIIDESYSNAVVKATIDKNGNLTNLEVTFDIVFDIQKVYGAKGHATGTTVVTFNSFKW